MDNNTVIFEQRIGVGIITLNRPKALNAINEDMLKEICGKIAECDRDAGIGAIVLRGSDKAFAAGIDVKDLSQRLEKENFSPEKLLPYFESIHRTKKPLIAAVAGYALGLGCELALSCDIILAADNARFGQPELSLGVTPGYGACNRLYRTIGHYKTAEMILTGRAMMAEEAFAAGIVSRIVPLSDVFEEAVKVGMKIAALPEGSVLLAKDALKNAAETLLSSGIAYENKICRIALQSEDFRDLLKGFISKKP